MWYCPRAQFHPTTEYHISVPGILTFLTFNVFSSSPKERHSAAVMTVTLHQGGFSIPGDVINSGQTELDLVLAGTISGLGCVDDGKFLLPLMY